MAPTLPQLNPARLRSYVLRLPLFTRITLLLILIFWIMGLQSRFDLVQWGSLIPETVGFSTSASLLANTPKNPREMRGLKSELILIMFV